MISSDSEDCEKEEEIIEQEYLDSSAPSTLSSVPKEIESLIANIESIKDENLSFEGCMIPDFEGILGSIRPLPMKWKMGKKSSSPTRNCFHVPTHHHEFCIEELTPPSHSKSERYLVKSHSDEYYFEPFFNPRDKSIHGRIGLCSQDFFDCVGYVGKITFEASGRRYCVLGLNHSFSGLYPNFLFRLGDLFPEEIKEVNRYFEEITSGLREEEEKESQNEDNPNSSQNPAITESVKEEKNSIRQQPNVKQKSGQVINDEEECEGEEEDEDLKSKKRRFINSYKYFKIDAYTVFGFILELLVIKHYFKKFLKNDRSNRVVDDEDNEENLLVDWDFVNELVDEGEDDSCEIQISFVQGNKGRDSYLRHVGIQDIINSLGPSYRSSKEFLSNCCFERAYERLNSECCVGRASCCGICFSSDVWLNKEKAVAVHYKCRDRKKEVIEFRKEESIVYPLIHVTENFLTDLVEKELEYLKRDLVKELSEVSSKVDRKIDQFEKELRLMKFMCVCVMIGVVLLILFKILEFVM